MDEKEVKINIVPEINLDGYKKTLETMKTELSSLDSQMSAYFQKAENYAKTQMSGKNYATSFEQSKAKIDLQNEYLLKNKKYLKLQESRNLKQDQIDKFSKVGNNLSLLTPDNLQTYSQVKLKGKKLGEEGKLLVQNLDALVETLHGFGESVKDLKLEGLFDFVDNVNKLSDLKSRPKTMQKKTTNEYDKEYAKQISQKAKELEAQNGIKTDMDTLKGSNPVRTRQPMPKNRNAIDTNGKPTYSQALSYPKTSPEYKAAWKVAKAIDAEGAYQRGEVMSEHRKNELFYGELYKKDMTYNASTPIDKTKSTIRQSSYGVFSPEGGKVMSGSYLTPDGYLMPSPSLRIQSAQLDILGKLGYGKDQQNQNLRYDGSAGTSLFNLENIYEDLNARQLKLDKNDSNYDKYNQAIENVKAKIVSSIVEAIENYDDKDGLVSLGSILKSKIIAVEKGDKRTSTNFKDTSLLASAVRFKMGGQKPSDFEATGFFNAEDMLTREGEGTTQTSRYDAKSIKNEEQRTEANIKEMQHAQEKQQGEILSQYSELLGFDGDNSIQGFLKETLTNFGAESVTEFSDIFLKQISDMLKGNKEFGEKGSISLEGNYSGIGYDQTGNSGNNGVIGSPNYDALEDEENRSSSYEELNELGQERLQQWEATQQEEERALSESKKSITEYIQFLQAMEEQIRALQESSTSMEERAVLGQYADQLLSRRTKISTPGKQSIEENLSQGANRFARFIMLADSKDKAWEEYANQTGQTFEQVKNRALEDMSPERRENFEVDYEDSKKAAKVFFDTLNNDWGNLEKAIEATFGTITNSKSELAEVFTQYKSIRSSKAGYGLEDSFFELVRNQLDPTATKSLNTYTPNGKIQIANPVPQNPPKASNIKQEDILYRKGDAILAPYGVTSRKVENVEEGDATSRKVTSTFQQAVEVIDKRLSAWDEAEQKFEARESKIADDAQTISEIKAKYGFKSTKSGDNITWSSGDYSKEEISKDKYRYQKAKSNIAKVPSVYEPNIAERERLLSDKKALQEAEIAANELYAQGRQPVTSVPDIGPSTSQQIQAETEKAEAVNNTVAALQEELKVQEDIAQVQEPALVETPIDEIVENTAEEEKALSEPVFSVENESEEFTNLNQAISEHTKLIQEAASAEEQKKVKSAELTEQLSKERAEFEALNEQTGIHDGTIIKTSSGGLINFGGLEPESEEEKQRNEQKNAERYEDYEESRQPQNSRAPIDRISGLRAGFGRGEDAETLIDQINNGAMSPREPQDWFSAIKQYQTEVNNLVKHTIEINKLLETQKELTSQIDALKNSENQQDGAILKNLQEQLVKTQQKLEVEQTAYDAAQRAMEETGVPELSHKTASEGGFSDNLTRQVRQIDENAAISLREGLATSSVAGNIQAQVASYKQADTYTKQYLQNLQQQKTLEADILRSQNNERKKSGQEKLEAQTVTDALKRQLGTIQSQALAYDEVNGTLNGVKLTQEQINTLNQKKAAIDSKAETTQARINQTYASQQGILESIGKTFNNSFARLVSMDAIANRIAQSVSNLVRQTIQGAKELNKEMVNLQIASGSSYSEIKSMMIDFNELATKVGKTTQEVASAANDWLRAGYEGQDAAKLVESSMQLSVLGMINSAQATEYLISVMKGWKLEVNEVNSIVDKLSAVDGQELAA